MKQEPKVAKRRHSQRFTMAPREILRRKLLVEILPASKAVLKSMTLDAEQIPVAFLAAASAALKTVGFAGRVKREEGSVCIFHRPARANVCLPFASFSFAPTTNSGGNGGFRRLRTVPFGHSQRKIVGRVGVVWFLDLLPGVWVVLAVEGGVGRVRGGGLGGFLEWLCCFSVGCVQGLS